jgi:hypothetical protein
MFVDGKGVIFACEKIAAIDRKMMPFFEWYNIETHGRWAI